MEVSDVKILFHKHEVSSDWNRLFIDALSQVERSNTGELLKLFIELKDSTCLRGLELIAIELARRQEVGAIPKVIEIVDRIVENSDISTFVFALSEYKVLDGELLSKFTDWTVKNSPSNEMECVSTCATTKDLMERCFDSVSFDDIYRAYESIHEEYQNCLENEIKEPLSDIEQKRRKYKISLLNEIGSFLEDIVCTDEESKDLGCESA